MKQLLLAFLILFSGTAHAATVTFHTECLEGEACAETTFTATRSDSEDGTMRWDTDAESLTGQVIASDGNQHFVFGAPSAAHLLTEYADGGARYTIHMDGPFTITYHGTCKETP